MNISKTIKNIAPAWGVFLQPVRLFKGYRRQSLRPDIVAGLTVAVILLPQAIAFALIAELPPQMGLFTAIVGALIGALWGSSNQIHTGPTNAMSLLVLSALLAVANPQTDQFILAAGVLALMVGLLQLGLGLARLGFLVNFVSHSVVVGFTTGAGLLIGINQLRPLLGLNFKSHNLLQTISGIGQHIKEVHPATFLLGFGTILLIILMVKLSKKLPMELISLSLASLIVFIFGLDDQGVVVVGQLPKSLPHLAGLADFDWGMIGKLSAGALAVGAIGLVETSAIARGIAGQSGQRLDSNQEFVGQGLANLFSGLFSGYPCAGSFSRSAVNANAGARTPVAAIFSALFVTIAMLALAPLAAYLPRAALAGVLIVTAYKLIDREEIARILRSAPGDAAIMAVTFFATIFLELEFAVLLGILLSFIIYVMRTSAPRIHPVLPNKTFSHLVRRPGTPGCPQLAILDLMGDLYFGAVNHIEDKIFIHKSRHPEQRFLLLRMHHVDQCDFSGIHMLETLLKAYEEDGGDIYLMQVQPAVLLFIKSTGFFERLGADHFLDDDNAIQHLFYKALDPVICIYECPLRVFKECQNLPKPHYTVDIPALSTAEPDEFPFIEPLELWETFHKSADQGLSFLSFIELGAADEDKLTEPDVSLTDGDGLPDAAGLPSVIDLREASEYRRGHIAEARPLPLPSLFAEPAVLSKDETLIFVCRSERRSLRAAVFMKDQGYNNITILKGGMRAWENAGLLAAVDPIKDMEEQNAL
ncbi:sulfate permease [Chloroflexota bacterium]